MLTYECAANQTESIWKPMERLNEWLTSYINPIYKYRGKWSMTFQPFYSCHWLCFPVSNICHLTFEITAVGYGFNPMFLGFFVFFFPLGEHRGEAWRSEIERWNHEIKWIRSDGVDEGVPGEELLTKAQRFFTFTHSYQPKALTFDCHASCVVSA